MAFCNMALALLTWSVLAFYWHLEMLMNLNIFIIIVKAFLKKLCVRVCMSVCV